MELSDSLLPSAVTVKMHANCGARRSLEQGQIPGRRLQLGMLHCFLQLLPLLHLLQILE